MMTHGYLKWYIKYLSTRKVNARKFSVVFYLKIQMKYFSHMIKTVYISFSKIHIEEKEKCDTYQQKPDKIDLTDMYHSR